MAAVVSGSGLGLFNTSLAQLGQAHGGQAGVGQALEGQYVNVATGNLVLQDRDESFVSAGLPISFVRTYNSLLTGDATSEPDRWIGEYEARMVLVSGVLGTADSVVRLDRGDGATASFRWAGTRYVSVDGAGADDVLEQVTTTLPGQPAASTYWRLTEGTTRRQEYYGVAPGTGNGTTLRLRHLGAEQSAQLYTLTWTRGRLDSVLDRQSNGLLFSYVGTSNRIESLSTVDGAETRQQVVYGYDTANRLITVTTDLTPALANDNTWQTDDPSLNNGRLFRTTYTYDASAPNVNRISRVTQSDGVVVSYEYYAATEAKTQNRNKVKSVTVGSSEVMTFDYAATLADGTTGTTVKDAAGRTWGYRFTSVAAASGGAFGRSAEQRLVAVLEPADSSGRVDSTIYEYDTSAGSTNGVLTKIIRRQRVGTVNTDIETTTFTPTTNGNVNQSVMTGGSTIRRTYTASNQVETETRVKDGNSSNDGVTRFAYDGRNRQRFAVTAEGNVTEFVYGDGSPAYGQVVAIRRFAIAHTAPVGESAPYSEAALASWAVTNASHALTTSFTYSPSGRLAEQIEFGALGQAALAANDNASRITRFIYNAQGMLLQRIVLRGDRGSIENLTPTATSELESFIYDGLDRLVSTVRRSATSAEGDDAATIATTIAYVDVGHGSVIGNRVIATTDTGATRIEVRNAAGRLVAVDQVAAESGAETRRTENAYDAFGRLRMARDAGGAVRYFFYNSDGTVAAEVDATGGVTRFTYDAIGRVVRTERFANRAAVSGWAAGVSAVPESISVVATPTSLPFTVQTSVDDRISRVFYDTAGRLVGELDGEGGFTSHIYDAGGRLVRTVRYATPIAPANRNAATVAGLAVTASSTTDRTTRYFYDRSDRQIGVMDAEGFLTELTYDGAGRLTKTTSFDSAVALANREAATLAALRPAPNASKDRVTRYYYDGRDQKIAEVDAQGYLTEWVYDEAGNQRSERRYAKELSSAVLDAETLTQVLAKRVNASDVRETRQRYNAVGQLVATVDIHGTTTTHNYDEAGRLVRTTRASGTTVQQEGGERDSVVRLNSFGEVIGEITGESLQRALTTSAYVTKGITTVSALLSASEADKDAVFASHGTRHAYDALGRKTETRDASGAVVWFFYDAANRLTHTLTGLEGNSQAEIVQTRYNAFGQIVGTTSYSARGLLGSANSRDSAQAIVDSLNAQSGNTVDWRDAWGNVVTNAQDMSAQTAIAYDRAGRQTLLTQAINRTVDAVTTAHTVTRTTYTAFGQIDTQTVAEGISTLARTTTFAYDRRGIVTSTTQSGGSLMRTSSVKTDAFGNAYEWTDARGVTTTATHDLLGRQLTIIRRLDGGTGFGTSTSAYDAWGRVLTHTDASNRTTATVYDDANRTITVTTGDGVVTTTKRNRHGEIFRVSLPAGSRTHLGIETTATAQVTEFNYDASGRLVRTERLGVDSSGGGALNGYDVRGLLVWSTDADGRRTIYRYDAAGRQLESILDPSAADASAFGVTDLTGYSSEPLRIRSQIRVDGQGRTVELTDGAGTVTRYEYDRSGLQTKVIVDPAGLKLQTVIERDALGQTIVIREGDEANPNLKVTRYEYDKLGRRTAERVDPDGLDLKTSYRYDANDNVVAKVDANGHTTRYVYDADNRLRFVVDPLNGVEENRYDTSGLKVENRRYTQAVTLTALQLSELETNTPSAAGALLASLVSGLASITESYAYDQGGQLESVTDGLGNVEKYIYDGKGQRRYRIDKNGGLWEWRYDTAGRVEREIDPLLQAEIYEYNGRGDRIVTFDRNGARWEKHFDAAGRLEREVTPQVEIAVPADTGYATTQTTSITTRYRYDGAGNVAARVEDAGGSLERTFSFEYDSAGRLFREISPPTRVSSLNDAGQLTHVLRSIVTEYRRDARGLMTARIEDLGRPEQRTTAYLYDPAGRLKRTTFPAVRRVDFDTGTLREYEAVAFEEIGYDASGREVSRRDTRGNTRHLEYDAAGRLRFDVDQSGYLTEYVLDSAGQQTELIRYATNVGTAPFTSGVPIPASSEHDRRLRHEYDAAGRRLRTIESAVSRVDDEGNSLGLTSPTTEYRYDANGNLRQQATKTGAASWSVTEFFYDTLGRQTHTVDALGYLTKTQFTALGQVARVTEFARRIPGWSVALVEGQASRGLAPSDPAAGSDEIGHDRTQVFAYDAAGRRTLEIAASGLSAATRYDSLGRRAVTTTNGAVTETRYDAADRVVATLEQSRKVLDSTRSASTTFDSIRELEVDRSPLTLFAHDAFGGLVGTRRVAAGWDVAQSISTWDVPAPEDQITRFIRDEQGRAVIEERLSALTPGGARTVSRRVMMRYDAADNLVESREALEVSSGRFEAVISAYSYDASGRRESSVVTRGGTVDVGEHLTFNAFGEVATKRHDGLSGIIEYHYDATGRLLWTNASQGQRIDYMYALDGSQAAEIRALPAGSVTIRRRSDDLGRTTRIESPATDGQHRQTMEMSLDRWGNVLRRDEWTRVGDGAWGLVATTDYQYNEQNQKTKEVLPSVRVVDGNGNSIIKRPTSTWTYDAFGRLKSHTDANDATTTTDYDVAGVIRERTDASGVKTQLVHDVLGRERLSALLDRAAGIGQDSEFEQYLVSFKDFDHADAVTQVGTLNRRTLTGPRERWIEAVYRVNALGHRLEATRSDRTTASYTVDSQGRVLAREEAGASYVSEYNTLGLKSRDGDTLGQDVWIYDVFGRERVRTDRSNRRVESFYDPGSGIKVEERAISGSWPSTPQSATRSFAYYANGQVQTITEVTARDTPASVATTTYEYNERGQRTKESLTAASPTGSVAASNSHIQRTESTFDVLGRLDSVRQIESVSGTERVIFRASYGYDAAGNRTEVTSQSSMSGIQDLPVQLLTPPQNQYVRLGAVSSFGISAAQYFRDPDGDPVKLDYRLKSLAGSIIAPPDWLTIQRTPLGELVFVATNPIEGEIVTVELTAASLRGDTTAVTTSFNIVPRENSAPELINPAASPLVLTYRLGESISFPIDTLQYFIERDTQDAILEAIPPIVPMPKGGRTFGVNVDSAIRTRLNFNGTLVEGVHDFEVRVADLAGLRSEPLIVRIIVRRDDPVAPRLPYRGASVVPGGWFDQTFDISQLFVDDGQSPLRLVSGNLVKPAWLNYSFDNSTTPTRVRFFGSAPSDAVSGQSFDVQITVKDDNEAPATSGVRFTYRQNQAPHRVGATSLSIGTATAEQYFISDRFRLRDYFDDADWDSLTLEVRPIAGTPTSFPGLNARIIDGQFEIHGKIPPYINGFTGTFELVAYDGMRYSPPIALSLSVLGGGPGGGMNIGPRATGVLPPVRTIYIGVPGQSFSVAPYFYDAEGDAISYRYGVRYLDQGFPGIEDSIVEIGGELDWLVVDQDTGRFSVLPTAAMEQGHVNIRVEPSSIGGILHGGINPNAATDFRINLVYPPSGMAPIAPGEVRLPIGVVNTPYDVTLPTFGGHQPISYSVRDLPAGLEFDPQSRRIFGSVSSVLTRSITYTASKDGLSTSIVVPLTINDAPTEAAGIPPQTVTQNQRWAYTVPADAFVDAHGDSVVRAYVLLSGIEVPLESIGLAFDRTTQRFYGTPLVAGLHRIGIEVRDGLGMSSTFGFDLSVGPPTPNLPPMFTKVGITYQAVLNEALNPRTLPGAGDEQATLLQYRTFGLPPGMAFDASTRLLSGTPTARGLHRFELWARDEAGQVGTRTIDVDVNDRPTPPTVSLPTGVPGQGYNVVLPAFTDIDGIQSTELVGTLPQGLSYAAGTRTLSGSPATGTSGSWALTYRATDTRGLSSEIPLILTIGAAANNLPVPPAGTVTAPFGIRGETYAPFELPAFTDPDGDALTYSLDSPLPPGLTLSGRTISGTPSARWNGVVTYRATDTKGGFATKTFSILVNERPAVQDGIATQSATQGVGWSFQIPANAYYDPDGDSVVSAFLVVWNGTTDTYPALSTLGLQFNGSTQTLSGTPTATGYHRIGLEVRDQSAQSLVRYFEFGLQVNPPANRAPVVSGSIPNASLMASAAPYSQTIPSNLFADPDGDVVSVYDVTGLPPGITRTGNVINGTPTVAGTYNVTVWGRDPAGLTANYTFSITVRPWHQQPVPGPAIPDQFAEAYQPWYFTLPTNAIVDPEGQPITYTASYLIAQVSPGVWDWISLSSLGLTFDPGSRTYSGWPPIGRHHIVVLGRDQELLANTTFFLDVAQTGGGGGGGGVVQQTQPMMAARMASTEDSAALAVAETPPASAYVVPEHILAELTAASEPMAMAAAAPEQGPSTAGLEPAIVERFSYDGLGRMTRRFGGTYESDVSYTYNASGHLIGESTLDIRNGQVLPEVSKAYVVDTRGRRVKAISTDPTTNTSWTSATWHYYDDNPDLAPAGSAGKLRAEVTYFEPGSALDVFATEDGDRKIRRSIAGWVRTAASYTYDSEGRVGSNAQWARPFIEMVRRGELGTGGSTIHQVLAYSEDSIRRFLNPQNPAAANAAALNFRDGTGDFSHQRQIDPSALGALLVQTSQTVQSTYNASGNLTNYSVQAIEQGFQQADPSFTPYTHTFTTQWAGVTGGWVEGAVDGTSTATNYPPARLVTDFDAFGRVVSREQRTRVKGSSNDRFMRHEMRYNADGQVVLRQEFSRVQGQDGWTFDNPNDPTAPKPNTRYVYSGGQALATLTEERGGYRTVGGSSERLPAQLAANGVAGAGGPYGAGGGSVVVQPGDTLVSLSQRVYGSGSYWYVLAEANGYDSPDSALPEGLSLRAPQVTVTRNDSGTFRPFNAMETFGPNAPTLSYIAPGPNGCEQAVKQVVVLVIAAVITFYLGPQLGAKFGAWGYAAAGAVGSVASQTAGTMMGLQDGIDWGQVGISALTAGATGGSSNAWVDTLKGVATDAVVGKLQGEAFSWRAVAASVIGNYAGQKIGGALGKNASTELGQAAANLAGKAAGGLVTEHAKKQWGETDKINYTAVAIGAVASTLTGALTGQHAARALDVRTRQAMSGEAANAEYRDWIERSMREERDRTREALASGLRQDAAFGGLDASSIARMPMDIRLAAQAAPAVRQSVAGGGGSGSAIPRLLARPAPNALGMDDVQSALMMMAANPRGDVADSIRIFDNDAYRYTMGSYEGAMTYARFDEVETLRAQLGRANRTVPGDPQLIAVFPDGMSRQDRLVSALRLGGGYFDEAAAVNLLGQVNSGASAIDLSLVRGQSEAYLQGMLDSAPMATGRRQAVLRSHAFMRFGSTRMPELSERQRQMDGLIASDALMPATLHISEKGVMREVQRAQMIAEVAGMAVGAPLAVGMRVLGRSAVRGVANISSRPVIVTPQGLAVTPEVLSAQGTSQLVGDFTRLQGATVEEIISRVPARWTLSPQQKGLGIRFIDEFGVERLRLHGPSASAPAGSNSAAGWTMRIHVPGTKSSYYDNLGNIVGNKANEGHIPIRGNPSLPNFGD